MPASTIPAVRLWIGVRTEGTEVAARVDAVRDSLVGNGARIVEAEGHPDESLLRVHDDSLLSYLASAWEGMDRRWIAGGPGTGPRGSVRLRARFADVRPPSAHSGRHLGEARLLRVRHDDPRRPGHLGGGPGGGRRRADRGRPRARRRADRVRLLPAARPSRRACLLRRLLLPEQRGGRGRRARRTPLGAPVAVLDIDAHHGNGTQELFYDRADVRRRLRARRSRVPAGSRTFSALPTRLGLMPAKERT